MARHIYFVLPEQTAPSGGTNVAYQFADTLKQHGYAVSVHYYSADFVHDFVQSDVPTTYSPYEDPHPRGLPSLKSRLARVRFHRSKTRRKNANRHAEPGPDDLLVIPEFWYRLQRTRFGHLPHVILVQNAHGALRGTFAQVAQEGWPAMLKGFISVSDACDAAVCALAPDAWHALVPVPVEGGGQSFKAAKKRQIAYMPRKRGGDAEMLVSLLRGSTAMQDVDFVPIDGVEPDAVKRMLGDALIFLSFSHKEGFGLPPAEAMAAGCITIGYTGVGGNEYFTPDVAFPVPEDDLVTFYRTVVDVVAEYDRDPTRLDAMRKAASEKILTTYTKEKTEAALLKAFEEIVK